MFIYLFHHVNFCITICIWFICSWLHTSLPYTFSWVFCFFYILFIYWRHVLFASLCTWFILSWQLSSNMPIIHIQLYVHGCSSLCYHVHCLYILSFHQGYHSFYSHWNLSNVHPYTKYFNKVVAHILITIHLATFIYVAYG